MKVYSRRSLIILQVCLSVPAILLHHYYIYMNIYIVMNGAVLLFFNLFVDSAWAVGLNWGGPTMYHQ